MTGAPDNRVGRGGEAGENGAVLVLTAIVLPLMFLFAAFVIDVGAAFVMKRHLQKAADAAALAAAQDLPDTTAADLIAHDFSGEPDGRNEVGSLPEVLTTVEFPDGPLKVRVTQEATSSVFFGGIVPGFDGFDVQATAVASRLSTTTGTPLAIFVHQLCGEGADKGLIINGGNALVEGGIHTNGHLEIGGSNFESVGPTSVYRPPPQGSSPSGPTQGGGCKDSWNSDAEFCSGCEAGPDPEPRHEPFRDWVTPYHNRGILEGFLPCTDTYTGGRTFNNTVIPNGVHCFPDNAEVKIEGTTSGERVTIIAGRLELGGESTLRPFNDDHPVIIYATNDDEVVLNPSGNYNWEGYVINRNGGLKVNADDVVSPQRGLLEAKWISVNGNNYRMLGTHPDDPSGEIRGGVALEE